MSKYGTVEHEGTTLTLTEEPYLGGDFERMMYEARAVDRNGRRYLVKWFTHAAWSEDGGLGKPAEVVLL